MHKLRLTQRKLKIKNRRLEELAITDKLTSLFNRVKLDNSLKYELDRAHRFSTDLSIIIIDIDDFKKVNDTYGHLVGDKVLINIAKILTHNIRKVDILGRWGGEEFLVICPHTDEKGVLKLAKNLREKIQNSTNIEELESTVTASFGITFLKPSDNIDSFIKRADDALYYVKSNGKNSIKIID